MLYCPGQRRVRKRSTIGSGSFFPTACLACSTGCARVPRYRSCHPRWRSQSAGSSGARQPEGSCRADVLLLARLVLRVLLVVVQGLAHGHEQLGEANAVVKTLPMPQLPVRLEYPALVTVPERLPDDIPQRQIFPNLLQFLPCGLQQIASQLGAQYKLAVLDVYFPLLSACVPSHRCRTLSTASNVAPSSSFHSRARIRTRDHLKRHG